MNAINWTVQRALGKPLEISKKIESLPYRIICGELSGDADGRLQRESAKQSKPAPDTSHGFTAKELRLADQVGSDLFY